MLQPGCTPSTATRRVRTGSSARDRGPQRRTRLAARSANPPVTSSTSAAPSSTSSATDAASAFTVKSRPARSARRSGPRKSAMSICRSPTMRHTPRRSSSTRKDQPKPSASARPSPMAPVGTARSRSPAARPRSASRTAPPTTQPSRPGSRRPATACSTRRTSRENPSTDTRTGCPMPAPLRFAGIVAQALFRSEPQNPRVAVERRATEGRSRARRPGTRRSHRSSRCRDA